MVLNLIVLKVTMNFCLDAKEFVWHSFCQVSSWRIQQKLFLFSPLIITSCRVDSEMFLAGIQWRSSSSRSYIPGLNGGVHGIHLNANQWSQLHSFVVARKALWNLSDPEFCRTQDTEQQSQQQPTAAIFSTIELLGSDSAGQPFKDFYGIRLDQLFSELTVTIAAGTLLIFALTGTIRL